MPVLRYFVSVGGALLALLFICNAVFPQVPLPATLNSGSDLPAVRIRSERKWPERVVIDTTVPTVAPVKIAKVDAVKADAAQQTVATGEMQKTKPRDAFAQMGTTEPNGAPASAAEHVATKAPGFKVADATSSKVTESKPEFRRPEPKPKRKVAKVHQSRPMMLVAQQPPPHFGFFDSIW
jgi:hypothetical protein